MQATSTRLSRAFFTLLPLASLGLIAPACSSSDDPPPAEPEPEVIINPADVLPGAELGIEDTFGAIDARFWVPSAEGGALEPEIENGALRLASLEPSGSEASSELLLAIAGFYDSVGAKLSVGDRIEASGEAPRPYSIFLSTDIEEGDQIGVSDASIVESDDPATAELVLNETREGGVLAQIGLEVQQDNSIRLVGEVLDAQGATIFDFSRSAGFVLGGGPNVLDVPSLVDTPEAASGGVEPPGFSFDGREGVSVRIDVQEGGELIRFFANDALQASFAANELAIPALGRIALKAEGTKFVTFADDFQASSVSGGGLVIDEGSKEFNSTDPGVIEFLFTLRDGSDSPLALDPATLNFTFSEGFSPQSRSPIDVAESNPLIDVASLPTDTVIVLDYSRSMVNAGGINDMVAGARAMIDSLLAAPNANENRVAVMAFSDANDDQQPVDVQINPDTGLPNFPVKFTSSADDLNAAIGAFNPFSGFSIVFDSVSSAIGLAQSSGRRSVKSVVFLTDGIDNSSFTTATGLANQAGEVHLFCIGVNAPPEQERELRQLALATRGVFVKSGGEGQLQLTQRFKELAGDLGNFYTASYVTSRANPGGLSVELSDIGDGTLTASNSISRDNIFFNCFECDTRRGILSLETLESAGSSTLVRVDTSFIPRDVGEFRIGVEVASASLPVDFEDTIVVRGIEAASGGLLSTKIGTIQKTYNTIGDDAIEDQEKDIEYHRFNGPSGDLEFGDSGNLVDIELTKIPAGSSVTLRVYIDNSVYPSLDTLFASSEFTHNTDFEPLAPFSGGGLELEGNSALLFTDESVRVFRTIHTITTPAITK